MPSPTTVLLRTQSDERLVALARAGHERAFEAIVERYRRPLTRACRRVLPEARAEDAVQQALVAAWTGLTRGDEVRELRPWLYRIAHNTALNQLRIAGYDYDELQGMLDSGPAPDEELERREVARRTLQGLAALPPRQREALLQIAVQGRGQEEVARTLGVSEPAVRQLVHRARTQLRAAATALTPMPLAGWFAGGGDVAASGGAAGVAAAVAKVSAVVVLAGGAVAGGPGVVDRLGHGSRGASDSPAIGAAEAKAAEPTRATSTPAAAAKPAALALPAVTPRARTRTAAAWQRSRTTAGTRSAATRGSDVSSGGDESSSGRRGHDEAGGTIDDHSGSGSSGGGDDLSSGSGSDDHSGPGGGGSGADDSPAAAPGAPVAGDDSHSGPGSGGDDDAAAPAPVVTPTATPTSESSHGGGDDELPDDGTLDNSSAG